MESVSKYGHLIHRAVGSVDYWTQAAMRRFVLDISRRMDKQNISRGALAERLNATPAYVTKVLRGDVNFTLETMAKLSLAVGGRLHVEVVDGSSRFETAEWHYERTKAAPAVQTERIKFAANLAANEPSYEYEKVVGHVA